MTRKNAMKKIISLLLLVLICSSLSNCGSNTNEVIETTDTIEETITEVNNREIIELTLGNYEKYLHINTPIDPFIKNPFQSDYSIIVESNKDNYIFNNAVIELKVTLYSDDTKSTERDAHTITINYPEHKATCGALSSHDIPWINEKGQPQYVRLTRSEWERLTVFSVVDISGTVEILE